MNSPKELRWATRRSCWNCHQKKIKCDRTQPCTPCIKSRNTCEYPAIDQKRQHHSSTSTDLLLRRLAELERKVTTLSGLASIPSASGSVDNSHTSTSVRAEAQHPKTSPYSDENNGILFSQDGQVRFFDDNFVADLARDAHRLDANSEQAIFSDESTALSNDSQEPTTSFSTSTGHADTINQDAGYRTLRLWQVYLSNVEPLIKVIHIPTARDKIYAAVQDSNSATSSTLLLINAVCFAALISLDDDDVKKTLSSDRSMLLQTYRTAAERGVSDFRQWTAPNLEYLQALIIFLTSLRVIDNTRAVWVLIGLAMRVMQALGVHIDGAILKLPPFETEIRRRLWWHIAILDARTSEDHGLLPSGFTLSKDRPLYPSNVNDEDLRPDMPAMPPVTYVTTTSTLTLLRIKLAHQLLQAGQFSYVATSSSELMAMIKVQRQKAESAYEMISTMWLASEEQKKQPYYMPAKALLEFSVIGSNFWIHFRSYRSSTLNDNDRELVRQRAVVDSLNILEHIHKIEGEPSLKQFRWYSKSNPQCFPIGFLLQQLHGGLIVEPLQRMRIYQALENMFAIDPAISVRQSRGAVWTALRLLKDKAFAAFTAEQSNPAFHPTIDQSVSVIDTEIFGSSTFENFFEMQDLDALEMVHEDVPIAYSQLSPNFFI